MIKKIKKNGLGLLILIGIQFLSNCLIKFLNLSFPAPLLGMIFLAVLLYLKVIPETWVEDISNLLLKNMALFFVPLFVGIVSYTQIIKQNLFPIVLIIVFTTFFTMLVTAFTVEYVIKITKKGEIE